MRYILIYILSFLTLNVGFAQKQHQKNGENFLVGMYALQSPVGTKGFQDGSVSDIEPEVLSAYRGEYPIEYEGVNCAIAYRHWNRIDYPNWNYSGFVKNYIKSMYELTRNESGEAGLQVLTPSLYSSFFLDPVSQMPTNDAGMDRELDYGLFLDFIQQVLKHEVNIVLEAVDNDSSKAIEILQNSVTRPLGGWYLDDEPLVRNHDIEIIQSMAKAIRLAEADYYSNEPLFDSMRFRNMNSLYHPRYIAFDSDDLHAYPGSSRPDDGKFYNFNGDSIKFSNGHIYSVFGEDVYEVLMPDFYHRDIEFWDVIFTDIEIDYFYANQQKPKIMPIISGQVTERDDIDTQAEFYNQLLSKLLKKNISGIWIYAWRGSNPKTMDVVETWTHPKVQLSRIVQSIK